MNESELEESLRGLCPVEPSPGLEDRIARALAATPTAGVIARPKRIVPWFRLMSGFGWSAVGVAVGVGLALFVSPKTAVIQPAGKTAVAASLFESVDSGEEVVSTEEAGTVYDSDNQPARLMRYTSIERHTWANPSTGAQVEVQVPREDLVAIPLAYQ
jgi:hypothetical protein